MTIANTNNVKPSHIVIHNTATISSHELLLPQGHSAIDALLKSRCSLQATSMVLLLSNDKYDTNDPIVEAAASNLALELSGQPDAQQLISSCAMKLHVDVYNHGMMGWEPLIEPWPSLITLTMPLTRCALLSCITLSCVTAPFCAHALSGRCCSFTHLTEHLLCCVVRCCTVLRATIPLL